MCKFAAQCPLHDAFKGGFIRVCSFPRNFTQTNRYGTHNKNEQFFVGHFSRKHAMGTKKNGNVSILFLGLCFVCGHLRI